MRRRRLLTITTPEPLTVEGAHRVMRAVEAARRESKPLVLAGGARVETHDLGPRLVTRSVDRAALAGRARTLKAHAGATRGLLARIRTLQAEQAERDAVRREWEARRRDRWLLS